MSIIHCATLMLCAVLLKAQAVLVTSYFEVQVHKMNIEANGITYEYYELPSDIKLTQTEFETMRKLLSKATSDYNHQVAAKYKKMLLIRSGNYGVQYKVKLDKDGDKIIEINAFAKKVG